jgi:protein SCO1
MVSFPSFRRFSAVALTALLCPAAAFAQVGATVPGPGDPASARPGLLSAIHIDQHLDRQLPLDLPFVDDTGKNVRLGDYFGKRPVVMALAYYECPMLCTQVLNGLVSALSVMNFEPGREFDVVVVSFNPREGPGLASQKKASYLERYGRPQTAGGWHFLTGEQSSIDALTDALGFRYAYDDTIKQFAHGAAIEVLTPKGHISKYFYGIEFSARDLRLGLIEASDERIGTPVDDFLLFCYHYDPATGKYGASVLRLVRLGGILTVLAFLSFLTISLRRDRRERLIQAALISGPSGGAFLPPDGGAHSAPATLRHAQGRLEQSREARERSGAWGPRERPSRGSGRSPD